MSLIAPRLLIQVEHPCPKVIPAKGKTFATLGEQSILRNYAGVASQSNYAELRLGWDRRGIHLKATVSGKKSDPVGDAANPFASDGLTLWIDTRESRQSHRATTFCHQLHFLAAGAGLEKQDPVLVQGQIHRALENAPPIHGSDVPYRCRWFKGGYELEAYLSESVLHGFDPESNRELGVFYRFSDRELGEQTLAPGVTPILFEDPTVWEILRLVDRD
jgi:hypothetical protein